MIEIKIPLVAVLDYKTCTYSVRECLISQATKKLYSSTGYDLSRYNLLNPNMIASDGYIIVQFMEQNK